MTELIGPAEIIARLATCAAGRREYAENAPDDQRAVLLTQAAAFDCAARIARGDLGPLYGQLPSWRWTPEMDAALQRGGSAPPATPRAPEEWEQRCENCGVCFEHQPGVPTMYCPACR